MRTRFLKRWWKLLKRVLAPPVLTLLGALAVICMGLAELHLLVKGEDGAHLPAHPAGVVVGMILAVAVATWVIYQCETEWLRAVKLDWASFRRNGWDWRRTEMVCCSLLFALVYLHCSEFVAAMTGTATLMELELRLGIAGGYAMWGAVVLSIAHAVLNDNGGGPGLQGALIPRIPPRPALRGRLQLQPF